MKDFIEKSLGMTISIENVDYRNKLPMLYSSLYSFKIARMQNIEWLIAIPKEKINLSQLRKHHRQIEKLLGLHCAVCFEKTSTYSKDTMISERIPFIIEDREIYLPFLGILLNVANERFIKPVQKLSFLAQKMILTAIYDRWNDVTVTRAAEKLGVTKMSASRCFDEIEFFDMPIMGLKGKSRIINIPNDRKALWSMIEVQMRNPVISRFYLKDDLNLQIKGGMSALAEYSMISDNDYPTYAVAKKDLSGVDLRNNCIDVKSHEPGCEVQEVGYTISFGKENAIDPLSLLLSLSEDEKEDERIEKSVKEMLEDYVW